MSSTQTDQFFADDSPLRELHLSDGICYEIRPQQVRMAHEIAVAFEERSHLCIEAPTGVGKTFAYLVPAIYYAFETQHPVVISTHTINLQEQILKKDLPLLNRIMGREITYAVGKGRGNYLCLRRLSQIADLDQRLFAEESILGELSLLLDWAEQTESGDYSEMDTPVSGQLWQAVCCERGNCLANQCSFHPRCFLFKARRKLATSQIIVANHAFFFSSLALSDSNSLKKDNLNLLPKFTAVILDEGHTLEDTAATHLGAKAETFALKHLLNRLYLDDRRPRMLSGDSCLAARKAVNELRAQSELFFNRLLDWILQQSAKMVPLRYTVPNHITNYLNDSVEKLSSALESLIDKRQDTPDVQQEFKVIRNELLEQNHVLNLFFSMGLENHVYWFERQGHDGRELSFNCVPVEIGPRLQEILFENQDHYPVIITSATLAIAGNISFFLQRIGLLNGKTVILDTPFDFQHQVKLYLGESMPSPDSKDFLDAAELQLQHFLTLTEGRAFVLFTSYAMMNQLAERMQDFFQSGSFCVYIQGGKYKPRRMLELFRKHERAVIFGTSSFWTGVDVSGEALSNVIICKLPFSVPDHPLIAARGEMIQARGGSSFREYSLPEAVLKFRQGFGRLIRTRDDKGIVVILDSRVRKKFYGRFFLESIPQCPVEMF
ncbi:MAG: helicase C-terminal domain-containing protein [Lentisphaeria bacterium]